MNSVRRQIRTTAISFTGRRDITTNERGKDPRLLCLFSTQTEARSTWKQGTLETRILDKKWHVSHLQLLAEVLSFPMSHLLWKSLPLESLPHGSHMVCSDWLAGQSPAASLARSTSDPESPSPMYIGDCHFVLAIILVQGDTILWQAAVTLLNIASLCDWLMTISWHRYTHVFLDSPVIGCLLPLDQEVLQYIRLCTIHTCIYSIH